MSKATDNESFVRLVQSELKKSGHYQGIVDGWAGTGTIDAYRAASGLPVETAPPVVPNPEPPATGKVDERSAKNIATLEPSIRPLFERIVVEGTRIAQSMGATGYVMISGTRTYAEQDALYAKGRSASGSVVTNARGGFSNHNFGIAGDFGAFSGSSYLDGTNGALASKIHKAVAAWVKANLPKIEWGGDWTSFRDEPHYQYRTGLTLAQMRERVAAGRSVIG